MRTYFLTLFLVAVSLIGYGNQRVGLVLSGGGAKGVAHIGVIKALEENDIPIDYIAGTSMGAIIAGLYASGYSPDEMLQLVTSQDFQYWSSGVIDPELRVYISTPEESPAMVSFPIGNDSVAKSVPQCLIGPNAMNFPFMRLFLAQTVACDGNFDKLFVPLRTVSSNLEAQRPEIARSGDLTTAIRASMSIPVVFCPVEIRDTLHYDGGIFDNFPVDVMREDFHPDIIIGSDVHTPNPHPVPNIVNQVEDLAVRPQSYELPAEEGIKIHMNLSKYNILDFARGKEIFEVGYRKGLSMIDSISQRITARRPATEVAYRRTEFKNSLPDIEFEKVICDGGTTKQNNYIASQFQSGKSGKISIEDARLGYYSAISSEQIANLNIQGKINVTGGLDLQLKAYPRSPWSIDLGAYITTTTTNMLYAALNYRTLKAKSINTALRGWVGINYMASELLASIRFGGERPYSLGLQAVVSRHNLNIGEKYFFQIHDARYVKNFEGFGRADLITVATGTHGIARLQAGYGYISSQLHHPEGGNLKINHQLGQLAMRYDYNTLNAIMYPLYGFAVHSSFMGLIGKHHEKWLQLDTEVTKYWKLTRRFSLGGYGHLLASGRKIPRNIETAYIDAPAFMPTPSCFNALNPSFRAYSFLGMGINTVWLPFGNVQLRGSFNIFVPWQRIGSDRKVDSCEFLGQLAAVFHIKKVMASAYGNYRTGNDRDKGFHAGISIGVLLPAPQFLR